MRVLVTGAGGFIGRAVSVQLAGAGHKIRGTFRRGVAADSASVREWVRLDLSQPGPDVDAACQGMNAVVHLAAHVHVGAAAALLRPERFRQVNATGTELLGRAAARSGARFVYLSSIGVNGRESPVLDGAAHRFHEGDAPAPAGLYARSKWEGECALRKIGEEEGLKVQVLRAPLVFGPGVGANFLRLLRWIRAGLPVPVREPPAVRSMMYVENLADIVVRTLAADTADGLHLVSDFDHEIPGLARRSAALMNRPLRLWRVPARLLDGAERLPVAGAALASLTRPLLIDNGRVRRELGWSPGVDAETAIARTVQAFLRADDR